MHQHTEIMQSHPVIAHFHSNLSCNSFNNILRSVGVRMMIDDILLAAFIYTESNYLPVYVRQRQQQLRVCNNNKKRVWQHWPHSISMSKKWLSLLLLFVFIEQRQRREYKRASSESVGNSTAQRSLHNMNRRSIHYFHSFIRMYYDVRVTYLHACQSINHMMTHTQTVMQEVSDDAQKSRYSVGEYRLRNKIGLHFANHIFPFGFEYSSEKQIKLSILSLAPVHCAPYTHVACGYECPICRRWKYF